MLYYIFFSSAYAQQDTRYQTYGQDYTQQYGAPAVDYSTSQADYTQHAQQSYDERAYAGYGKSYLNFFIYTFHFTLVYPYAWLFCTKNKKLF